ncbi:DUF726-domain-containing protein [Ascodesmis nigricans]|uniref:DUF726-domain-containing protein n=1 Tax=Ascodesmis nigricans TaxID=341454 RepID=A0A4S2MXP8_9PEZI|nr:DUF726-domain-containing protein [Ascodesmis nigricans]
MSDSSLTTLLTPSQRQDLFDLLSASIATLRAHIIQIFPTSSTADLKTNALTSFDTWRDSALSRFHEALDSSGEQSSQRGSSITAKATNLFSSTKPDPSSSSSSSSPPLTSLPEPTKQKLLAALLLLLLSLHTYDSRSRILLLSITSALSLPASTLSIIESTTAIGLLEAAQQEQQKKHATGGHGAPVTASASSKWTIPLVTLAGAALIGVTGGLATPLVAAGVSSILSGLGLGATAIATYLGTAASSTAVVGALFGVYGARRSNEIAERYVKEVGEFRLVRVKGEEGRLRVAVGVTGWVEEEVEREVVGVWRVVGGGLEVWAVRWETEGLVELGRAAGTMVREYATGWAKKQIIRRTILATLSSALWPLSLLKASKLVDNPFSTSLRAAHKTGHLLAHHLLSRPFGSRPITLLGFSLGSSVIFDCCRLLSRHESGFGIIENVVFIGAPVPAHQEEGWREVRAVAAGRVVNVFAERDWVLAFLYRTADWKRGVAGLQRVEGVEGVENVDVTESVGGHLEYRYQMQRILRSVLGEDVVDGEEVVVEVGEMGEEEEEEEEEEGCVAGEKEFEERVEREVEIREVEREEGVDGRGLVNNPCFNPQIQFQPPPPPPPPFPSIPSRSPSIPKPQRYCVTTTTQPIGIGDVITCITAPQRLFQGLDTRRDTRTPTVLWGETGN